MDYTAKVSMKVVQERSATAKLLLGTFTPSMNETTVGDFIAEMGTDDFYLQMPLSKKMVGGGKRARQPVINTTPNPDDPQAIVQAMNLDLPVNDMDALLNMFADNAKAKQICDATMAVKQSSKLIDIYLDELPQLKAVEDFLEK